MAIGKELLQGLVESSLSSSSRAESREKYYTNENRVKKIRVKRNYAKS